MHRSLFILACLVGRAASKQNETMSGLVWSDVSVQTMDGTFLLQPNQGFIQNSELVGVIGPSGAGKSTFLSCLGGTIWSSTALQIDGDVFYQNAKTGKSEDLQMKSGDVAWLQQKDAFFSMLTVRETLELAAFLELPTHTERQRLRRVQLNMDSLGLSKLQHRKVGEGSGQNGLSGGEQRRLSLALELIASPKLFIADEPTSGLDSTMSNKVVKLIKKLCKQREIPCVISLHQPSSSLWRLLDSVILMAPGGRVCYMGKVGKTIEYFKALGYTCPQETNPAEFLLDLVSIDSEDPYQSIEDEARIALLAAAFVDRRKEHPAARNKLSVASNHNPTKGQAKRRNWGRRKFRPFRAIERFGRLVVRSWRQNIRNTRVNAVRLLVSGGNAYLFSAIFRSIQKGIFTAKSVADRTAILTFGVINISMMALVKTVDLFAKEKPIVRREQQRNNYSSLEYILSKVIAEIPLDALFSAVFTTVLKATTGLRISWRDLTATFGLMTVAGASLGFAIGSFSSSGEMALAASIPILVVLMTVGVINPSGVADAGPQPAFIGWLKELSPIAHAVKAVCLAEYDGMEFENESKSPFGRGRALARDLPKMGALALVQDGKQVLHELGLDNDTYGGAMRHLVVLSAVNLLMSWMGMRIQASQESNSSSALMPL